MIERDQELLHRFLDGELSSSEREELEREMAQNPELAQMRKEFEDVGRMLRGHIEEELNSIDFGSFYAGIESRLPAAVTSGAAVVAPTRPVMSREEGMSEQVRSWWSRLWVPALVGAAAAAAVAIFALNRPVGPTVHDGVTPQNVVVDAVSNEGNKTVLVSMPVDEDDATVIWLIDGEEEGQTPIDEEDPI
jgi:negative regulator of sigma E activity